MIHFLYADRKQWIGLSVLQTNFLTLPPNPVFKISLYQQFVLLQQGVSRWLTGNRGCGTGVKEVGIRMRAILHFRPGPSRE